jgi:AmiR/NasT family two-component response regulator
MFSTDVGRMDPDDVRTVQALADVATIGLLQEQAVQRGVALTEQLQGALNSRVIVEQAKGAIAQMRSCTVDEAFTILRDYCRSNNLRLSAVAHAVVTDAQPIRGLTVV